VKTVYLTFSPFQQEMTLQEDTDCMTSIQFLVYHQLNSATALKAHMLLELAV